MHGGFEGNAQSLRIVARLEKKVLDEGGKSYGLDLCYRTLAAIIKYDKKIPRSRNKEAKFIKGYYASEGDLVKKVKKKVVGTDQLQGRKFKTIECSIMDIADDIAYSTFDLEDSFKAAFLTPAEILASSDRLWKQVAGKVTQELGREFTDRMVASIFADLFGGSEGEVRTNDVDKLEAFIDRYVALRDVSSLGSLRTKFSSQLVHQAINAVELDFDEDCPPLSRVVFSKEMEERVETLKQYTFVATIYSSRVKLPEYRGYDVVKEIFDALADPKRGYLLMPDDVRAAHEACDSDLDAQMRVVCDFVAGMTDRYAMEFHGRLRSDTSQSMFKPI